MGYELTTTKGKIVLIGVPLYSEKVKINTLALHFGKEIKGSHGGNVNPEEVIQKYLETITRKKIKLEKMISNKIPLIKINEGIRGIRDGKITGKCLIDHKLP